MPMEAEKHRHANERRLTMFTTLITLLTTAFTAILIPLGLSWLVDLLAGLF